MNVGCQGRRSGFSLTTSAAPAGLRTIRVTGRILHADAAAFNQQLLALIVPTSNWIVLGCTAVRHFSWEAPHGLLQLRQRCLLDRAELQLTLGPVVDRAVTRLGIRSLFAP